MRYGSNHVHARALNWGLSYLGLSVPERIVELGCGSGRNIEVLLAGYPEAKITAIDPSPFSVEKATGRNRKGIMEGRCVIERGSVSDLKLEENSFDLAVAFDTIYNWPDLEACFSRALKVLRPGGKMIVVNETDGNIALKVRYEKYDENMTCYTAEEIREAFVSAGFSEADAKHHPSEQWIVVSAVKGTAGTG